MTRSGDSERRYLLERVADGSIQDVRISHPPNLTAQMLEYSDATRDTREQLRAGR